MSLLGSLPLVDWLGSSPAVRAEEVLEQLTHLSGRPGTSLASATLHEGIALLLSDLEASLLVEDPGLLGEQLFWHRRRLEVIAPTVSVIDLLEAVVRLARDHFDDHVLEGFRQHLDEAVFHMPTLPSSEAPEPRPLGRLARRYLACCLDGRTDEAVALLLAACEAGENPRELLLCVLEPAQRELGALWERGAATVAQEHLMSGVTERLMSLLHERMMAGREVADADRRLVAVAAGAGTHAIGLRMVSDLLEDAGWRVTYLGGGVPVRELVEEVVRTDAQLVAVSASMPEQIRVVRTLTRALRADPRTAHVKVLVGGRLFRLAPTLALSVGADDYAGDGREAVAVCDRLFPRVPIPR